MIKFLHIMLLAAVKYIVTLPYAMIIGMEYKYAILAVLAGGIGGFLFFYYLSKPLNRKLQEWWPCLCRLVPNTMKQRYAAYCEQRIVKRKKNIFSRRSRFIAKIKGNYGLWGIIITTPIILTIPIGAFLASKYYAHKKHIVFYMILSIVGWGLVLSGFIHLFPNVFF